MAQGIVGKGWFNQARDKKKPPLIFLIFPNVFYTFGHLKHYSKEKHGPSKKIPSWQQPVLVKELSKAPSFIAFQMYG